MKTFLQDLRYAARMLRSSPAFAAIAIGTLALGIGANTAIFSLVRAVLLEPLPFADADRVVNVMESGKDSAAASRRACSPTSSATARASTASRRRATPT